MRLLLLSFFTIILNAYDAYDEAIAYLEGDKGATKKEKIIPRCPYERCDGKTTYLYVEKDLKKGYQLLLEAHNNGDVRASFRGLKILSEQMNYKSKIYDDYLLTKLKENYNLTTKEYNKDVLSFLEAMAFTHDAKYKCKGSFRLYEAYSKGYFGLNVNNEKANENKVAALEVCTQEFAEYFQIQKNK